MRMQDVVVCQRMVMSTDVVVVDVRRMDDLSVSYAVLGEACSVAYLIFVAKAERGFTYFG